VKTSYDALFAEWGAHFSVNPHLLKAQAYRESLLDPHAASHAGAVGLAQFMLPTWRWAQTQARMFEDRDRTDPVASVALQAWYMRNLLDQFDGHVPQALAAYNWGPGNVRRHLRKYGRLTPDQLPTETERYIVRIFDTYGTLANLGDF
jgi:soluble lytic murein transglycosylase-like protein